MTITDNNLTHTLQLKRINGNSELIQYTHKRNSEAWKSKYLTVADYVKREATLGESEIALQHSLVSTSTNIINPNYKKYLGLNYFVLEKIAADTTLTNETENIVCRCETMNRIGYMKISNKGSYIIIPVLEVVIGAVFTPVEFRGMKYAQELMFQLNNYYDTISREKDEGDLFLKYKTMILYSEVGEYYSKFGYSFDHVPVHHLKKLDLFLEKYCLDNNDEQKNVHYLGFDGYEDLVNLEQTQIMEKLSNLELDKNTSAFTAFPDMKIYKWFELRDIYISQFFLHYQAAAVDGGSNSVDDLKVSELKFGVEIIGNKSHIIWHHAWVDNSLQILKVYTSEDNKERDLVTLFKYAIKEAKKYDLSDIYFWDQEIPETEYPNFHKVLKETENKVNLFCENSSLSGIRPSPFVSNEVKWENNTKFGWF
ncbi:uncharacterized protein SCDLUD_002482 [Saccharomycodes ludwigii]|uniref:uncharacterized protein n=1 Tax=Saccharomycodes ludwigii TaxID=36035 RepID=UPI001E831E16|nr:hypothetical protein SCDLUD_002482 [Saccharomycodes ludwigii]KAH3901016.1 hypothetical protein SCDLUD_002482 [Saccharomycodes ludwigii]